MATIYDLFEVTGISPHTTYSTGNGNLLGVVDGMTSSELNDGEFDVGDIVQIGGVSYTIDEIKEPDSSGRFTEGDGTTHSFDPRSESNLDVVFLTVSNGGDIRHFIIPNDRYGDMNVEEIRTGDIGNVGGSDAAIISTTDDNITVVCFAAGTRIATPTGEVAVDLLRVGDPVNTRDHGPQKLRAVLVRDVDFATAPARLKPIAFEPGSLGAGRPVRRLCVSPHHRMLVTAPGGAAFLVPAKALTDRPGVRVMQGKRRVTYFHLVFDRHEVIWSEGTPTESFYPGPVALAALPPGSRHLIHTIFPDRPASRHPAAPILTVQTTRRRALSFG